MNTPHSINLTDQWSLYHFTKKDVPSDLGITSAPANAKLKDLTKDGGFLVIPSPQLTPTDMESLLSKKPERQSIINNIADETAMSGFLGLLNFKKDYKGIIESIDISKTKRSPSKGIHSENMVTITFKDGLDMSTTSLDIGLNAFGTDHNYKKSDGLGFDADTNVGQELDVITSAVYEDEAGNKIYEEYLIPTSLDDVLQNSVEVKLDDEALKQVPDNGLGISPSKLIKKIKLFLKKIIGTVRKELVKLKGKAIDVIIKSLKVIKKKIRDPYKILKYNFGTGQFEQCPPDEVKSNQKTLVFIHGTLKGSFDGRFRKGDNKGSFKYLNNYEFPYQGTTYRNWFDFFTSQSGGVNYEQIIALEHETVMDSPLENVERFLKWGLKFNQPVSIVSASRGGLLAKTISSSKLSSTMPIERTVIVAGGYTNYFDKEVGVKRYINMIANIAGLNIPIKFLLSLTVDIILELPGLKVMTKTSDDFDFLISRTNVRNPTMPVVYYTMTSNYQPIGDGGKFLKKIASHFLGDQNDLAVPFVAQRDTEPGLAHPSFPLYVGSGQHGRGLKAFSAKMKLYEFLSTDFTSLP